MVPTTDALIVAGLHVPVTPLFDVVGRVGVGLPWQTGGIWVNVGVTWLVMTTFIVAGAPHWPGPGVNV